jgi:hypothetical protein
MHALARLADGCITPTHDREPGETRAKVDFDSDAPRRESLDGERGEAGEHATHREPRRVARGARSVTNLQRMRAGSPRAENRRKAGTELSRTRGDLQRTSI